MNTLERELRSLQLFHGLDDEGAAKICGALGLSEFAANQAILKEGECIQALWIILSGECIVSRSAESGPEHPLAILNEGDVFGEMSFVRTAPHSASIRALTDVTACCYRRDDFLKLSQQHPDIALQVTSNIADVLAERLRRMDTWVCEIMARPDGRKHRSEWETFRSAVYTNWDF
ncbi:MAG: cyclic nucleotide-binding domain-containing protein [Fuerstiella sp.]|jgi:CRP-like cAMP-binding protein|nr:cyclic nucleotide-binding domain-containing protein [Fuerstiella sp.]MCP4511391.1 cyclic nucleotide-binding domain-containing protein [Fuerstiella sp.]MDG2129224.1 cyclic nucleotide-binding domain-containing protein [Fuerstiella sp.]